MHTNIPIQDTLRKGPWSEANLLLAGSSLTSHLEVSKRGDCLSLGLSGKLSHRSLIVKVTHRAVSGCVYFPRPLQAYTQPLRRETNTMSLAALQCAMNRPRKLSGLYVGDIYSGKLLCNTGWPRICSHESAKALDALFCLQRQPRYLIILQ